MDRVVEQLLPRSGDTNRFIQAELHSTLAKMARALAIARVFPALTRVGAGCVQRLLRIRTRTCSLL